MKWFKPFPHTCCTLLFFRSFSNKYSSKTVLCYTQCSLLCSNIQHNLHIFYNSFFERSILLWTNILALLSRTVKTNENCFSSYLNAKRKNFNESRFPLVKGHISWREKKRNLSGITRNNWFFYFFSLRAKFYYYNHI